MNTSVGYSVRKLGDNYGLYYRNGLGRIELVDFGIFASRKTALKHKRIAESERLARKCQVNGKG